MARWRDRGDPEPVPAWIGHDGFVPADWAWPSDLGLPGWLAEDRARGRWVATRHRWLQEHPGAGEVLLEQLRERCREKRRGMRDTGIGLDHQSRGPGPPPPVPGAR